MVRPIDKTWKEEWIGMPEFIQEDKKPIKTIKVHFETKEDMETFSKLVGKEITDKTIGFTFPVKRKDVKRYCVDG
jgi:hypothetical protein